MKKLVTVKTMYAQCILLKCMHKGNDLAIYGYCIWCQQKILQQY